MPYSVTVVNCCSCTLEIRASSRQATTLTSIIAPGESASLVVPKHWPNFAVILQGATQVNSIDSAMLSKYRKIRINGEFACEGVQRRESRCFGVHSSSPSASPSLNLLLTDLLPQHWLSEDKDVHCTLACPSYLPILTNIHIHSTNFSSFVY
ncbi:hypothetical protein KP509_36G032000 [Ceratopteris richardii]|uniref:Uncharacterized protein n=1 Tax=Ceratopteris richardii TaxID=49495 RepID=A0A8T2QBT8_CERRI|nr:hypothetical protein KP509_36G032000 [Ceratopteris richardii]